MEGQKCRIKMPSSFRLQVILLLSFFYFLFFFIYIFIILINVVNPHDTTVIFTERETERAFALTKNEDIANRLISCTHKYSQSCS